MEEFNRLLEVADTLLGPNGCPWDKEQTIFTLQPYLLEETHELIEAIDAQDPEKIKEELGDVLYALVFIAKLSEGFTLPAAIRSVAEKLIRRHPHIFGDLKIESSEDVARNWEELKKKEGKKSPIEGIPPTLPSLSRAQKVVSKLRRARHLQKGESSLRSEEELGEKLWHLVKEADAAGIDAESALRRFCLAQENLLK